MVDTIVIDTNLAVKWVLSEDFSEQADALYHDTIDRGGLIAAPPLLLSEVTNAIYQAERRKRIAPPVADAAVHHVLDLRIDFLLPPDLYHESIRFARLHNLTAAYDSQYAALAQMLGTDLWTADESFMRSLPRSVTHVRWLGDYQPA